MLLLHSIPALLVLVADLLYVGAVLLLCSIPANSLAFLVLVADLLYVGAVLLLHSIPALLVLVADLLFPHLAMLEFGAQRTHLRSALQCEICDLLRSSSHFCNKFSSNGFLGLLQVEANVTLLHVVFCVQSFYGGVMSCMYVLELHLVAIRSCDLVLFYF